MVSLLFSYLEKFNRNDSLPPSDIWEVFGLVLYGVEIPIGKKLNPQCGIGLAWDDFDRFLETTTGKETLHDTVDITH